MPTVPAPDTMDPLVHSSQVAWADACEIAKLHWPRSFLRIKPHRCIMVHHVSYKHDPFGRGHSIIPSLTEEWPTKQLKR